jgi:L-iditol 2-dehydrogenase
MKALVKFALGADGVELREIPKPYPAKDELLVKILAAGICASDIHAIHDQRETVMPVVLGHEFVAVVEEVGSEVTGFEPGDYVTALPACYSCGDCIYCDAGEVTLCKQRKSIGSHKNGAMAEYMVCPAKYCFKVPEDDPDKLKYAAAEPLACAVRGVYEKLEVKPGDVALVSGPGAIGLFVTQCLKERGAHVVISGLPTDRLRLEKAVAFGADKAVESLDELKEYLSSVAPLGADISVDCAGAAPSVDTCLSVTRTHGQFLIMGVFGKPTTIDINKIFLKELRVTASNSSAMSSWHITMDLLSKGIIDIRSVLDLELPLREWKKGFDSVTDKTALKVLLIP